MAIIQVQFYSECLKVQTKFNMILPEPCEDDVPVVFLLHGMYNNEEQWIRNSSILRYATARNLAVVMPDAGNSYYTDMKYGGNYYTYVTKELVEYVRKVFPVTKNRDKTFIAGLSMGGYGAVKCALSLPEQYAACASLSGCLDVTDCLIKSQGTLDPFFCAIWGDDYLTVFPGSKDDIYALVEKNEREGARKPWIFQACGTDDFLYENNRKMKEFIEKHGYVYRYTEGPGAHNFTVWDRDIVPALDFFLEYMKQNA